MTAKVELIEGETYGPGPDGRSWLKGIPQFLADSKAIQDYKSNSRFFVTEMESAGKVKAAPSAESVDDKTSEEVPATDAEEGEKAVKKIPKKDKLSSKRKHKGRGE